ncbi:MAG: UDP-2,3-diacylglucosamine diphosphatase [Pseudomonadota bacterium]
MKYRTILISDIHLGTRGCQAPMLLDFLEKHEAETYYLIGDIFDGWRLQRGWHWPQTHNDVVQMILERAHEGARIVYVPGNHDEVARKYLGVHFGGIEVVERSSFDAIDGRTFLVTHGDQFDSVVVHAKWLALLGDRAYVFMLWLNTWVNRVRVLWGGQYWSLSKWAKAQVKRAVSHISAYERVLADEARRGGFDGVVCGHIHSANMSKIQGLDYINTGDWVESCTAVVEHQDGTLELIDWARITRERSRGMDREERRRARRLARTERVPAPQPPVTHEPPKRAPH